MGVACGAHALHDGLTDLIYVMLPVWQAEFGLLYTEIGLLRGIFAGTMAGFQIPASAIAGRFGAAAVLAIGTALSGLGFGLAGASASFAVLAIALFIGGLGSSTQHPLASELVAQAYAGPRSRKALGLYNFAGDIGKMTIPALAALLLVATDWRAVLGLFGVITIIAAAIIYILTRRVMLQPTAVAQEAVSAPIVEQSVPRPRWAFPVLLTIGLFDSSVRMAFLTFLPFVLTAKGASLPTIGLALTLVFFGGAIGKLVCTFIGARIGPVATVWLTESLTTASILALLPLSLETALVLLPVIGIVLNGTSSVLYGSVPDLVTPQRRARAFGLFYTGTIGSGAVAPALLGIVGDAFGVTSAVIVIALLALVTLPLAAALRPALQTDP
jgi:FSR family fosmidomycin resistance protein-like MFS transporter